MDDLRRIHAHLIASGLLHSDKFLLSEMLRFCALSPAGDLPYARSLLLLSSPDAAVNPMLSSWNHLIRGYSQSNSSAEAILLFLRMRGSGLRPNELTFPFVLKSCAELADASLGEQVHADVLKNGVDSVVYVRNTLMHLYGSCGRIDEVRKVFEDMPLRTVVSWNTMLSACVDNSVPEESIGIFFRMKDCGFEPDQTTYVILLSAAAELGSLSFGRLLHGQIIGAELVVNLQLGTALVNMYAKCGAVTYASLVFDRMPVKNVLTWSAMILGFAQNGSARRALELFEQMKVAHIKPNYVTFLGVLCACSHTGLVNEAYRYFHEMVDVHGIEPRMTHYSTIVDVLGRRGHLREAYDFVLTMPVEPDAVVWRTLLSACHLHCSKDEVGIAQDAQRRLLQLEPLRSGNYVIAANLYSDEGSWEEAAKMRKVMREERLKKAPGESCIELFGTIYRFISGEESCEGFKGIYQMLDALKLNMRATDTLHNNSLIDSIEGMLL